MILPKPLFVTALVPPLSIPCVPNFLSQTAFRADHQTARGLRPWPIPPRGCLCFLVFLGSFPHSYRPSAPSLSPPSVFLLHHLKHSRSFKSSAPFWNLQLSAAYSLRSFYIRSFSHPSHSHYEVLRHRAFGCCLFCCRPDSWLRCDHRPSSGPGSQRRFLVQV